MPWSRDLHIGGEIESIDDFYDEARQVILGEPVIYRWGQQVVGLAVGENEVGHINKNPSKDTSIIALILH